MVHHCPRCKKAVTTKCINHHHVEYCPEHEAYNEKGRTCPACAKKCKREEQERKKKEQEEKKSAVDASWGGNGRSKKHRKGSKSERDGDGKSKRALVDSSEAPRSTGWGPQVSEGTYNAYYTNTSQAPHDGYAHDHTTAGHANDHQSAGTDDEQSGDTQLARTGSGSSSSAYGASSSSNYAWGNNGGHQDDTQIQEAQNRAYRPAPELGASAYTEYTASQEISDYYNEDVSTPRQEGQAAYSVEGGSNQYVNDSTGTSHGYN